MFPLGWRNGPIRAGTAVWNEIFADSSSHLCGNKCETPYCRTAQNGHSQGVRLATATGQRSCNVQDRYSQINGSMPTKFAFQAALSQFNGNRKCLISLNRPSHSKRQRDIRPDQIYRAALPSGMLSRNPGTCSMGRGPFGVMKLYKLLSRSVRQRPPGHGLGPTRPSDRLGLESIFAFGGSADR